MLKKLLDWPPIWAVLSIGFVMLIAKLLPIFDVGKFYPTWIWIVIIAVGVIYLVWAEVEFLRAKTSVIPRRKPSKLITTGPFKISRNPIYTGFAMIIFGVALKMGMLLGFLAVPIFVMIIQRRFIADEEKAILETFPDDAPKWFKKVNRW